MKDKISLVVTDSGLGGLSVVAGLVNKLVLDRAFSKVEIIYFNAWPSKNSPYNSMPLQAEKILVFNSALQGMLKYKPEVILIACNTLSVLYPATDFSRNSKVKVIDIVDFGVKAIYDHLQTIKNSKALILGTPTTIESNVHCQALLSLGIDSSRVAVQPCNKLAGKIEKDPQGAEVDALIFKYIKEAALQLKLKSNEKLLVVLCCTHYGYSQKIFQSRLNQLFNNEITILNPNDNMSKGDFLKKNDLCSQTSIEVKVVSRIKIDHSKIDAISHILNKESPLVADALNHYQFDKELFYFNESKL